MHLFTIGHSTHDAEHFIGLLTKHDVTAVADVRSVPASRFTPQFNREAVAGALRSAGIRYVFLGHELGARSNDPTCYIDGKVQYSRLAATPEFASGIARLRKGLAVDRVALMCAEQEPLDCHRTVLVARVLAADGVAVDHIHSDGGLESHGDAIHRLMVTFGLDQPDLFHTHEELVAEALARQEQRIAYVDESQRDRRAHGP